MSPHAVVDGRPQVVPCVDECRRAFVEATEASFAFLESLGLTRDVYEHDDAPGREKQLVVRYGGARVSFEIQLDLAYCEVSGGLLYLHRTWSDRVLRRRRYVEDRIAGCAHLAWREELEKFGPPPSRTKHMPGDRLELDEIVRGVEWVAAVVREYGVPIIRGHRPFPSTSERS